MSKTVTCSTLVWLRDRQFEAGTKFAVVDVPEQAHDVDPATAAAWERNGWLKPAAGKKSATAGEGA